MQTTTPTATASSKLTSRALSASAWVAGGYAVATVIRFGSNLVMTRLLSPDLFGVMALALTFQFALQMFSDIGLNQVAIQHRDGNRRLFMHVLWTVQIARGALLTVLGLLLCAGVVLANHLGLVDPGSVYAHPDLPGVLAVIAFNALIGAGNSTRAMAQGRELNLKPTVLMQIWAQIAGLVVMLAWAMVDRSVYALAAGTLASAIVVLWMSHAWLVGEPDRLAWDREVFAEIWKFGRWIIVTSMLGFGVMSGDRVLLSGYLDAVQFGLYSLAIMIVLIGHDLGGRIGGMVGLAALSEIHRDRPHDLRRAYYKLRLPMDALGYAGAGFLWVAGGSVIDLLYDDRYAGAGLVLQVLGLTLVALSAHASGNAFLAIGRTWVVTVMQCMRLTCLLVFLPWLAHGHGFIGAVWGVVISYACVLPVALVFQIRFGLFSLGREALVIPLALVGLAAGWLFQHAWVFVETAVTR